MLAYKAQRIGFNCQYYIIWLGWNMPVIPGRRWRQENEKGRAIGYMLSSRLTCYIVQQQTRETSLPKYKAEAENWNLMLASDLHVLTVAHKCPYSHNCIHMHSHIQATQLYCEYKRMFYVTYTRGLGQVLWCEALASGVCSRPFWNYNSRHMLPCTSDTNDLISNQGR